MRKKVQAGIVLLLILLVVGLGATFVARARDVAMVMGCSNNLKQLGLALHTYHDVMDCLPVGTVPTPDLPPHRRLGWLVEICPVYLMALPRSVLDRTRAWDDPVNRPLRLYREVDGVAEPGEPLGDFPTLLCPANPAAIPRSCRARRTTSALPGWGRRPRFSPDDRRVGCFGYDRKVRLADIKDGQSTTLLLLEAADGGPWTAGGRATVRGLEAADGPYLGKGGSFEALHRGPNFVSLSFPIATNVAFADGSVRALKESVSPRVLEGLATLAGGEEVGPPDAW